MPLHVSENHFSTGDTVQLGGTPYIKGDAIVWLDLDDGLHKRYVMDKGALVLQYWDINQWKNV